MYTHINMYIKYISWYIYYIYNINYIHTTLPVSHKGIFRGRYQGKIFTITLSGKQN